MKNITVIFLVLAIFSCFIFSCKKTDKEKNRETPQIENWEEWKVVMQDSLNYQKVLQSALTEDFEVYTKRKDIPKPIMDLLEKWSEGEFSIANPDEPYNATDNARYGLPFRQIIFILKDQNHIFIYYNHGGLDFHRDLLWAEYERNKVINLWVGWTNKKIVGIKDIQSLLLKKQIESGVCF